MSQPVLSVCSGNCSYVIRVMGGVVTGEGGGGRLGGWVGQKAEASVCSCLNNNNTRLLSGVSSNKGWHSRLNNLPMSN